MKQCEKCNNFKEGICTLFGEAYQQFSCCAFENSELQQEIESAVDSCYCDNCMSDTAKLVDVKDKLFFYKCENCGKTYSYSLEELK